jgi:hypothetical protein
MKNSILLIFVCTLFISSHSFAQRTVAGVSFTGKMVTSKGMIFFNGAGLREKYNIDLYVGALYLKNQTLEGPKVVYRDEPMAMSIVIVSKRVTRDKFTESVEAGFKKSAGNTIEKVRPGINKLKELLSDPFSIDDKIDLIYLPEIGTQIKVNGKLKGTIKGLEFKKALFGIWFGSNPVDKGLKDDMLGKL